MRSTAQPTTSETNACASGMKGIACIIKCRTMGTHFVSEFRSIEQLSCLSRDDLESTMRVAVDAGSSRPAFLRAGTHALPRWHAESASLRTPYSCGRSLLLRRTIQTNAQATAGVGDVTAATAAGPTAELLEAYRKLQNGSDIRGVALPGVQNQDVTLNAQRCVHASGTARACVCWPTMLTPSVLMLSFASAFHLASAFARWLAKHCNKPASACLVSVRTFWASVRLWAGTCTSPLSRVQNRASAALTRGRTCRSALTLDSRGPTSWTPWWPACKGARTKNFHRRSAANCLESACLTLYLFLCSTVPAPSLCAWVCVPPLRVSCHASRQVLASPAVSVGPLWTCPLPIGYAWLTRSSPDTSGHAYDASIMLTASHLPWNRNGMKFFTQKGGLGKKDISALVDDAAQLQAGSAQSSVPSHSSGEMATDVDFLPVYAEQLVDRIRKGVSHPQHYNQPLRGFHIVVDAGNGAGGFFASHVLQPLGADTSGSQFLDPDGRFPNHIPNPEDPDAVASASQAVKAAHADLGIVFDTDVDRSAIIDRTGAAINRNRLIALLAAIVLRERPGATIVTDSVTSDGLAAFISGLGGKHFRYRRGYKNVIDKGVELAARGIDTPLMIETSGHGAMAENHYLDDGAYLAVKVLIEAGRRKLEGKGSIEQLLVCSLPMYCVVISLVPANGLNRRQVCESRWRRLSSGCPSRALTSSLQALPSSTLLPQRSLPAAFRTGQSHQTITRECASASTKRTAGMVGYCCATHCTTRCWC